MSTNTKKAIKSITGLIKSGDYEAALYEATETLKQLEGRGKDSEAAQVLLFRGLALNNLGRNDEAEKCYVHGYKLQPHNELATRGLTKHYEKTEQWDKLGRFLEVTLQSAYDNGDAETCSATLQDLLELRQEHGTEEQLYQLLRLCLPSSPLVALFQSIPPPTGSFTPFPAPIYPPRSLSVSPTLPKPLPHVLHLMSSLPLLLNLLIRSEAKVHQEVESKVKAGRTRLGAGPEKEVRKNVDAEVLGGKGGSEMVELLREVAGHAGVEDAVRREVEIREFEYWRKLVGCLPAEVSKGKNKAKPDPATEDLPFPLPPLFAPAQHSRASKAEALSRAEGLAKGFVLLEVSDPAAESAWTWLLEGKDEPTIYYDIESLHKFALAFPESAMADFIDDYCRWFHLPLPQPEEDEESTPTTDPANESAPTAAGSIGKTKKWGKGRKVNARERRKLRRVAQRAGNLSEDIDQEERDELVASMTKLLEKLPKSIFAHRVMARISIQEEDWANAVTFAEKARSLIKEIESERGVSMSNARLSADTALGVPLVPYFPPKHHSRAARLLNGVLSSQPNNVEARCSRGIIFETAENWSEARKTFQMVLDLASAGEGVIDENKGTRGETAVDPAVIVGAKEEVGWCLVNEGKLDAGRTMLEEVVEIRDTRWEESKKEDEAFPRARAWWRLGKTEWMIGDDENRSHAEEWFTASIRALPTFAPAYTSLGSTYLAATPPDTDRALKCFQKAFELDPTEVEAAKRLAKGYADDDEWALVRLVAGRVMEGEGGVEGVKGGDVTGSKGKLAPKNGWAWKALGSTEMHYRNYAKAAQAYQIALRADSDDVSTWIQLGESYSKCGRHMAALKTLQHALDLDSKAWIAWYHIGDVHLQLGSYELAIESFERVRGNNVTTLSEDTADDGGERGRGNMSIGVTAKLAEAYHSLGQFAQAAGFRQRSELAFCNAIRNACEVLRSKAGHRPWAWKVIGDAAFLLDIEGNRAGDEPAARACLEEALQLLVEDDEDKRSTIEGLDFPTPTNLLSLNESSEHGPTERSNTHRGLRTACYAYTYRSWLLKNEPRVITSALYDLTSALYALSKQLIGTEKKSCLKVAVGHARGALERDAGDERLWNALGVVCAEGGKEVAQHAFVVSLELYTKDPMVWTNLGYLYLRLPQPDLDLASQCFLKAQIMDPDHARAWLGQGLIADRQGDKDQAKALFAHSVTLSAGSLLEADLAAATTALLPFLNSGSFSNKNRSRSDTELHGPAFALRHYTHQRPSDATAHHLYGLICEQLGLVDQAIEAFTTASHVLEHEFEHSESAEVERRYSVALVNLARCHLARGEHSQALDNASNALELISSQSTTQDGDGEGEDVGEPWIAGMLGGMRVQIHLVQALSHFWLGDVEKSLEAFQVALDGAEGQIGSAGRKGVKEYIAVLLARTLWGLGGDEARETAKSHLMECLSSENPSISVITTLAAIALISSDEDLIEASISELKSLPLSRRMTEDPTDTLSSVLVAHSLSQADGDAARGVLEKGVRDDPSSIIRRLRLAKFLLATGDAVTAESLLALDPGLKSQEASITPEIESQALLLRGVARLKIGSGTGAVDVQKAIRASPWDESALEILHTVSM